MNSAVAVRLILPIIRETRISLFKGMAAALLLTQKSKIVEHCLEKRNVNMGISARDFNKTAKKSTINANINIHRKTFTSLATVI